jgi:hypothetical protein
MRSEDQAEFFALLDATYDLIGVGPAKVISASAKALFFQDLRGYPLQHIKGALAAHRVDPVRGKFTPKPADIVFQIEAHTPVQWLGADEVWALMPKSEDDSGILNQVTAQALAVAIPLLAEGDDSGARMAFRAAYNRLVERAKQGRQSPIHFLSPGKDRGAIEAVRAQGIEQGLLAAPESAKSALLEAPIASIHDLRQALAEYKPKVIPHG